MNNKRKGPREPRVGRRWERATGGLIVATLGMAGCVPQVHKVDATPGSIVGVCYSISAIDHLKPDQQTALLDASAATAARKQLTAAETKAENDLLKFLTGPGEITDQPADAIRYDYTGSANAANANKLAHFTFTLLAKADVNTFGGIKDYVPVGHSPGEQNPVDAATLPLSPKDIAIGVEECNYSAPKILGLDEPGTISR